ncbi:MAG: hypothetical protein GQ569_11785 [Methylococcaceae bacterium]|nr:hypothetical protein [Methylococcaceae bacterium]
MKIRSVDELEQFFDAESAWRKKELTTLKLTIDSSRKHIQEVLLRSAVPILYAHWEGLLKQLSIAMLTYIVNKGHRYNQLKDNFHAFAILEHYKGQFPAKRFDALVNVISKENIDLSKSIKIDPQKYIDTKSNLNSEVLKDITIKLGISYVPYELKENFIDESFLKLRNSICHGERLDVKPHEFKYLYQEVINLMETFKNQLLNQICQQSYLR